MCRAAIFDKFWPASISCSVDEPRIAPPPRLLRAGNPASGHLLMTRASSRAADSAPTLAAIYRHVGDAHQRIATAAQLDDDVAAACLEDLYAALELLENAVPSFRAKATRD